ncbi:MAG: hypothetical protein JWO05_2099 [Gemmatimonadetes bacterium]|nr:hypothetical protein [Gemmatimonadota bacterium]
MIQHRRAAGVVTRQVAGELVLVSTVTSTAARAGDFFVLNESAEILWNALETPQSGDALARHLTLSYGIAHEQAVADVEAFVASAREYGVITTLEE